MGKSPQRSGTAEATILVKALPQIGERHGETVCVAALDKEHRWHRLYPISFRQLDDARKFGRWDLIRFKYRLPDVQSDNRAESRNVDQQSIEVLGQLRPDRRSAFIEPALVSSTKAERANGRSLALVRPEDVSFHHRRRTTEEIERRRAAYARLRASPDMFATKELVPLQPAPFEFSYRYRDADGEHTCRCHDWEVEQTFTNWRRTHNEATTLDLLHETYGDRYPKEGMVLAMGTHSRYPDVWMIIGVIRMRPVSQPTLL